MSSTETAEVKSSPSVAESHLLFPGAPSNGSSAEFLSRTLVQANQTPSEDRHSAQLRSPRDSPGETKPTTGFNVTANSHTGPGHAVNSYTISIALPFRGTNDLNRSWPRIYVYDLDGLGADPCEENGRFTYRVIGAKNISRKRFRAQHYRACRDENYDFEHSFMGLMKTSQFRTTDPALATHFYVPAPLARLYMACRGQKGRCEKVHPGNIFLQLHASFP